MGDALSAVLRGAFTGLALGIAGGVKTFIDAMAGLIIAPLIAFWIALVAATGLPARVSFVARRIAAANLNFIG